VGRKRIPHFETDEEAAEFWDTHSFADYIDDTEPADDVVFTVRRPAEGSGAKGSAMGGCQAETGAPVRRRVRRREETV